MPVRALARVVVVLVLIEFRTTITTTTTSTSSSAQDRTHSQRVGAQPDSNKEAVGVSGSQWARGGDSNPAPRIARRGSSIPPGLTPVKEEGLSNVFVDSGDNEDAEADEAAERADHDEDGVDSLWVAVYPRSVQVVELRWHGEYSRIHTVDEG